MLAVTFDRDNVNRLGFVRVHINHEAEIRRQVAADFFPVVAVIVGAHHVPVLLHEEHAGTLGVHSDMVDAVADLSFRIGNVLRAQPLVGRLPGFASIVGAECAGCGNGDPYPLSIARIENDRVQAHAAGTGLPLRTGAMAAQSWKLFPVLAAIGRAK